MNDIAGLVDLIHVKQIDEDIFEGQSSDIGSPILFGGQVLAQALNAAKRTVDPDKFVHSLHGYFLLTGNKNQPVQYEVEKIREGKSFVTRRILGKQDDRVIFLMATSFHRKEESPSFQIYMPEVKGPEGLKNWDELYEKLKDVIPERSKAFFEIDRPIEFRPAETFTGMLKIEEPHFRNVWMRVKTESDNKKDYSEYAEEIVAYMSDYNLLSTALQPLPDLSFFNTMMASLDHSMWFHRPIDIDNWLLYQINNISTQDARGLCQGRIFNPQGDLLVSVAQEGLIRPIDPNYQE